MGQILIMDNMILDFIQKSMHSGFLDQVMPVITALDNGGAIWIAVGIIFLLTRGYRRYGFALLLALLVGTLVGSVVLKPLVARVRPFEVNTAITLLIARPTDFSFPSGHAMSSFTAATVILKAHKKLGIIAFIVALLIAFSRLYLYVHYPSDVLVGMIFGVVIGIIAIKVLQIQKKRREGRIIMGSRSNYTIR